MTRWQGGYASCVSDASNAVLVGVVWPAAVLAQYKHAGPSTTASRASTLHQVPTTPCCASVSQDAVPPVAGVIPVSCQTGLI